jgi:hypothetical protein
MQWNKSISRNTNFHKDKQHRDKQRSFFGMDSVIYELQHSGIKQVKDCCHLLIGFRIK